MLNAIQLLHSIIHELHITLFDIYPIKQNSIAQSRFLNHNDCIYIHMSFYESNPYPCKCWYYRL
ncbi:hypothetical protein VAE142_40005 [Vibrio aestuarianus]|nr:hypothetical protein VAE142_40005 [Vibrio aestuarianus]